MICLENECGRVEYLLTAQRCKNIKRKQIAEKNSLAYKRQEMLIKQRQMTFWSHC